MTLLFAKYEPNEAENGVYISKVTSSNYACVCSLSLLWSCVLTLGHAPGMKQEAEVVVRQTQPWREGKGKHNIAGCSRKVIAGDFKPSLFQDGGGASDDHEHASITPPKQSKVMAVNSERSRSQKKCDGRGSAAITF